MIRPSLLCCRRYSAIHSSVVNQRSPSQIARSLTPPTPSLIRASTVCRVQALGNAWAASSVVRYFIPPCQASQLVYVTWGVYRVYSSKQGQFGEIVNPHDVLLP